jgi:heparin binding hemagglutinin HbhA
MGATAAILCGVPMQSEAGHFDRPEGAAWERTGTYRIGFLTALREVGGRVRSMGGWTADVFGQPSATWVDAVDNIKPLGVSAPEHARSAPMHHVKNTGETVAKFWARDQKSGLMTLHRLRPGEAVEAEIDPNQPKFAAGAGLAIRASAPAAVRKAAAPKKAPARKPAAKKPTPPAAPPASEEA